MNKLNVILFVLLIALVAAVYVDMNTKYNDLCTQLQVEKNERQQDNSAIEKDLRLLKTDTDILMYGYEENYDR